MKAILFSVLVFSLGLGSAKADTKLVCKTTDGTYGDVADSVAITSGLINKAIAAILKASPNAQISSPSVSVVGEGGWTKSSTICVLVMTPEALGVK